MKYPPSYVVNNDMRSDVPRNQNVEEQKIKGKCEKSLTCLSLYDDVAS